MNFMTIFLLVCGAAVSDVTVGVKMTNLGQQGLFQGDIRLPKQRNRNGVLKARKWPNNTVYYDIDVNWNLTEINATQLIQTAMEEIENKTCIKFVRRTTESIYVTIINGTGCNSPIGYPIGYPEKERQVSLEYSPRKPFSCLEHHTIVHELLHTVGLWHEQARYDRDNYVKIDFDNVAYCMSSNYYIQPNAESNTYGVPYNYMSVMHYKNKDFALNMSLPTIIAINLEYNDLIGETTQGNATDYDKVNRIYQCGGYQNFTIPPTSPSAPTPAPAAACSDFDCRVTCPTYANLRACDLIPDVINERCSKCASCGKIETCPNNDPDYCAAWAIFGYCNQPSNWYYSHMAQYCAKTCLWHMLQTSC